MADNNENEETRNEEQQNLKHQQQDLFRELSREQADAEKVLEGNQKQQAKEKQQAESDD